MIKAMIFDIGGVILNLDGMKDKLLEVFHPDDIDEFWQKLSVMEAPLARAEINEEEFWKLADKEFNAKVPTDKDFWLDNFRSMMKINEEMLDIISRLKGRYKLGVISNINDSDANVVRDIGILKDIDEVILSYEVKMAKDDKRIFQMSADRLKVDVEECVFIDDVEEWIENCRKTGMKAILFESNEKLIDDLKGLGVVF